MNTGEESQGRPGSGAGKAKTRFVMDPGVSGMEHRESLELWLWPTPHNMGPSGALGWPLNEGAGH